jgi:hypothetical protein
MEGLAAPLITAVVGVVGLIGGYLLGNRRLKYERLHERQAEVIARMSELLAAVQSGIVSFTHYYQRGDVDRHEQVQEANRSYFELVDYYRANEVWLEPETCKKKASFGESSTRSRGTTILYAFWDGYRHGTAKILRGNRLFR